MAQEIGGIFSRLRVDGTEFKTGLDVAGRQIVQAEKGFLASFARTQGGVQRGLMGITRSMAGLTLGVVAPLLSVNAAIRGAKDALSEFDEIAKSAKASGLSGEAFQQLAYQADLGGVSVDKLSAALETFNKNAGLASAGKGRMITALKALHPELLRNIQAATSQEERLRLVADALDKEADASRKAAIATALFGDSGTRMVEVLKGGSAEMARMGAEARRLGLVVSNDLLANSERLNDELAVASKILDLQFKSALVELAPILVSTAQFVGGLASAIGGLVDEFAAIENRSTSALEGRLATLKELIATAGSDITMPDGQIVPENAMALSIGGADTAALEQEKALIEGILAARESIATLTADTEPTTGTYTAESNAAAAAAIKQAEAVKALIADLTFEKSLVGESALEQRILTAQRQAGVAATSDQGQAIRSLITDMEAHKAAIEANSAAMETFRDLASDVLSGFVDDLRSGESATDALSNAFGRLGDRLIDMALDQSINWLLSSLLGSVTGTGTTTNLLGGLGLYAKGGIPPGKGISAFSNTIVNSPTLFPFASGVGLMGEAGPEAIMPLSRNSRGELGVSMVAGASGLETASSVAFSPSYEIDARGSTMSRAEFKALLEENNKKIRKDLPAMLADARKRGAI